MMKVLFKHLFLVLFGLTVAIVFLELTLRFLPVRDGPNGPSVNRENPVLRFYPNQEYRFSKGPALALSNSIRTNNYGFVSGVDYDADGAKPLVAIIGDSYVEALMVPPEQTMASKLRDRFPRYRWYSFAASGAALGAYLGYAEFAKKHFEPEFLVVVLIANDFDESIKKYNSFFQSHFFEEQGEKLVLTQQEYEVSLAKVFMRESALVNYLVRNLHIQHLLRRSSKAETRYVGNVRADVSKELLKASEKAFLTFLEELPERSGVAKHKTFLVLDGIRPELYSEEKLKEAEGSYFQLMRDFVSESAAKEGFDVIDMQPVFIEHFKVHGEHFEFEIDAHWNALGHSLVAHEVANRVRDTL